MLIGELSRRTEVSERLLRYYERVELIRSERRANGYRDYAEETVETVRQIRALLAAGFPHASFAGSSPALPTAPPCARAWCPRPAACPTERLGPSRRQSGGGPRTAAPDDRRRRGAQRLNGELKDTMVRAGQSSEKAALIHQHSDEERQEEVAAGLDATVRKARTEAAEKAGEKPSGTNLARGE